MTGVLGDRWRREAERIASRLKDTQKAVAEAKEQRRKKQPPGYEKDLVDRLAKVDDAVPVFKAFLDLNGEGAKRLIATQHQPIVFGGETHEDGTYTKIIFNGNGLQEECGDLGDNTQLRYEPASVRQAVEAAVRPDDVIGWFMEQLEKIVHSQPIFPLVNRRRGT